MSSANAAPEVAATQRSSLPQRVLSAVVAVPVLAVLIWLGVWAVAPLVALATALCLYELYGAFAQGGFKPRVVTGIACGLLFCAAAAVTPLVRRDLAGLALAASVCIGLCVELARRDREGGLVAWALTLAGACYVGWLFSHFILLAAVTTPLVAQGGWLAALHIPSGSAWVYAVMAITWLQDTGAYFVGRALGKHKMAPSLSPKKTWEGAAGGLLAAIATAVLLRPLLGLPVSLATAVLLGLVGGIAGPIGDLAESFIKRQVNVKDAGTLIPGHGGVLDRVDSLLFTGPLLYYLIVLLT